MSVTVTFEPESVNAVTDLLTITGGAHGEYKCNLKGVAKAPGPQVCPSIVLKASSGARMR